MSLLDDAEPQEPTPKMGRRSEAPFQFSCSLTSLLMTVGFSAGPACAVQSILELTMGAQEAWTGTRLGVNSPLFLAPALSESDGQMDGT